MTFRFYRAATIGDGLSPKTAFRSKLANYIDGSNGTFDDWSNRSQPVRFCFVQCEPALHAIIEVDADIMVLSPEFDTAADVEVWLSQPLGILPTALVNRLEADGIPMDKTLSTTTRKQLWRRIARQHFIFQRLLGMGDNAFDIFKLAIDNRVNTLTPAVRTRVSNWMQEHGLDISWITGTTSVREVINFVVENLNGVEAMKLGGLDFDD